MKHRQFITHLLVAVVGVLGFMTVFAGGRAFATINLNPDPGATGIPASLRTYLRNCDAGTQSPAFAQWIAPRNAPSAPPNVTVPYGAPSVLLDLHFAGAVCFSPSSTLGTRMQVVNETVAPNGRTNVVGRVLGFDFDPYQNTPGTYRHDFTTFSFIPPGGFTTSGTYTIQLDNRPVNFFGGSDYRCVAPPGRSVTGYNYGACPQTLSVFTINVTVTAPPPPPTLSCNAITQNPTPVEPGQAFTMRGGLSTSGGAQASYPYAIWVTLPAAGLNNTPLSLGNVPRNGSINVNSPSVSIPNPGQYSGFFRIFMPDASPTTRDCPFGPSQPNPPATVATLPYYRAYGGDVFAGAGFQDGASGPCRVDEEAHIMSVNRGGAGPYTGAGSQLAAAAMGLILDFASGQGPSNSADPNRLSFANNGDLSGDGWASSLFGGGLHRENAVCAPDYLSAANGGPGGNAINPTTAANQVITTQSTGVVTIGAGTLAAGAKRTIYVNGNVFITGNITYAGGSYPNAAQIPAFRLIARGNIYVEPGVTQLDGLYVSQSFDRNNDGDVNDVNFGNPPAGDSQGRFYTCASSAWVANTPSYAPNSANMVDAVNGCRARRLTVVGAVIAEMIKFNRSLGTQAQSTVGERYNSGGNPAEVFIYSPEVWMNGDFPARGDFDSLTALPPVL